MPFADMKNDFVFRKIFGTHPDILRRLLNDLLEREGSQAIEQIEYLPSEQLPIVTGAKLSILDVRCKDKEGNRFIVEIQLIHVPGFIKRVVYNACKAYVDRLGAGKPYSGLTDVVAVSICDFELWPDAKQDAAGKPRVPMLSRWFTTERSQVLGTEPNRLLEVQYAFLELPKLPDQRPTAGADLWAWLFVHAPDLSEIPSDFPEGPYREALSLANQSKFSQPELDAYHKAMDEIQQARDFGEEREARGFAKGESAGFAKGETAALTRTLLSILAARSIVLGPEEQKRIDACRDPATFERWILRATTRTSAMEVLGGERDDKA